MFTLPVIVFIQRGEQYPNELMRKNLIKVLKGRILTLGHIVRLTMLAECGISTQKLSEIQEKCHC